MHLLRRQQLWAGKYNEKNMGPELHARATGPCYVT